MICEATMTPFTTVQMFRHDDQYDGENMTLGLWDALHGVNVGKQRALCSFFPLTLGGMIEMAQFRTHKCERQHLKKVNSVSYTINVLSFRNNENFYI